ncbi:MAG: hypothetical protein KBD78_00205 [Oligoflexales bacterium]|nr:hypothetical protein [Oligoflexales bacterium]
MVQIGDLVSKAGIYTKPGVVVEKKQDGSVVIDTEPMSIHKYHRYANTTGLNELDKEKYNTILDEIYKNPDDVDRLNDIQREIDNLKKDPANKGVVQYLQNQQRSLIRTSNAQPRTFNVDESTIDNGIMAKRP